MPNSNKYRNEIQAALFEMRDADYAAFQQKLMPTVDPQRVIGMRTPMLRAYAKRLSGSEAAEGFLSSLPHTYYDENNLHGALLDGIRDYEEALCRVEEFLPYIDNWATCDMFCPKVLRSNPDRLWERILAWLASDHVYTVRYALVRLTSWYLDDALFRPAVLEAAADVTHEDYYVRMAQAWLFSIALVKQYDTALPYLTEHRLSPWVHNKAIQKAIESYRVPTDRKILLKTIRIPTAKKEATLP